MSQTRQTVLFPSTEIVWFRISIGKSNDLVTVKHLRVWERIHWESTFQEVQKPSSCIVFLGTIAGRLYWRSSNMGSTVYSPGKRNDDHTSHYSRGPIQKPIRHKENNNASNRKSHPFIPEQLVKRRWLALILLDHNTQHLKG